MQQTSAILYKIVKLFLGFLFRIVFQPTISGKENIPKSGRVILAGNHKKAIDPALVALSTHRVVHFLAKKELHTGAFRWFFKSMATIPVDRSKKDKHVMESAVGMLNNDQLIGLFPEGTRNKTKELLLPFKYGAVSMSKRTNTLIVPFAIVGEYKLFRKGITIKFGTPIDVSALEAAEANDLLMNTVKNILLEEKRRG